MKVIELINKAKNSGQARFTIEVLPPLKGEGTERIFEAIDPLMEYEPAYVNITFHREDVKYVEREDGLLEKRVVRKRPGTVGIAGAIMRRYNVPVVPHVICGGMSKYDIEDMLIDLDFLGINNVLALRGDGLRGQRGFKEHQDGHRYASQLVEQITQMNDGVFIDREVEECKQSQFCIGVAGYPEKHMEAPNIEKDIEALKEKIEAGAHYIVTQMCFDNRHIFDFIDRCRAAGINVPIIPGIKPISTKSHLNTIPEIFHVDLPQELVEQVEKCKDNKAVREVGVEWATEQVRELKQSGIPIIHLYSMGKTDNIQKIVKALF